MREIRFRAWNVVTKTMIDLKKITPLALNMDTDGLFIPFSDGLLLMQYCGLLDKNGKEIYEGDIVTFLDGSYISTENGIDTNEFISTGVIEWCGERKGWDVTNREDVDTNECFDEYMEVIGNVHENPELLKK